MAGKYNHGVNFPIYNTVIKDGNGEKRGTMRVLKVPGQDLYIIGVFDSKKRPYEELKINAKSPEVVKSLISDNMVQGLVRYESSIWQQYVNR
jgi:hypothetical protein